MAETTTSLAVPAKNWVQEVAARLRERMEGIAHSFGNAQEHFLFAVTSLLLADELEQREKELTHARGQLKNSAQGREINLASTLESAWPAGSRLLPLGSSRLNTPRAARRVRQVEYPRGHKHL